MAVQLPRRIAHRDDTPLQHGGFVALVKIVIVVVPRLGGDFSLVEQRLVLQPDLRQQLPKSRWVNVLKADAGVGDLVQHHGQDLGKGPELTALPIWLRPQIELNVDTGGIGVVPTVGGAQPDP